MAPSSRDRISVDLRGMKAALLAQAMARGVSPSDLVREAVAGALGSGSGMDPVPRPQLAGRRVRLSLRMRSIDAEATRRAARDAGMATCDFIAAIIQSPCEPAAAVRPAAALSSLTASCAELATLSRNLNHLTTLLRQGSGHAAQQYRQRLDSIDADVRAHLDLATTVVTQLRPLIQLASK